MSESADLTVQVMHNRDIIVGMPGRGFEVTYRRDGNLLVADDIFREDINPPKLRFLTDAWKAAYSKARQLGWLAP